LALSHPVHLITCFSLLLMLPLVLPSLAYQRKIIMYGEIFLLCQYTVVNSSYYSLGLGAHYLLNNAVAVIII